MGSDESADSGSKKKSKTKQGKKKKTVPGQYRVTKLRKILKAVGLANPKLYKGLKELSNKKQILKLEEILSEHNIDFSNLSEKAIKKLKAEHDLKKEMADLGIDTSVQIEDGEPLSSRRPRRNQKVVSYRPQKPKLDSQSDDSGDDKNANDDKAEHQRKEEEEEANDESS